MEAIIRRVSMVVMITMIIAASAALVISEPNTSVKYRIFHFENGQWVEYLPTDQFPPGGNQPGSNLWKYEYMVYNWSAPQPLRLLYLFFNSENISMDATWAGHAAPAGWTATAIGPFDPDFNWKERFMATKSSYYIPAPDSLGGFAVEFTWTANRLPGSQLYDAVYSGGSESSLTHHAMEPTSTESSTWGRLKSLYR